jgi:hypothetical protein
MCSMMKAVLVGIDKYDNITNKGCVNDVLAMRDILRFKHSVLEQDIRMVVNGRATYDNILDRLEWLISHSKKTQNLLFYFSGSGTQIPTRDYEIEVGVDAFDEAICPSDFTFNVSNPLFHSFSDLHTIIKEKDKSCRLVIVLDCSYAGNVFSPGMNPSDVVHKAAVKAISTPVDLLSRVPAFNSKSIVDIANLGDRYWGFSNEVLNTEKPLIRHNPITDIPNTIVLNACSEYQVAVEADFKNRYQGAFSYCLQKFLYTHPEFSLRELEESTARYLKSFGFSQIPVFNVGRETNSRKLIISN